VAAFIGRVASTLNAKLRSPLLQIPVTKVRAHNGAHGDHKKIDHDGVPLHKFW
jgi:hypothetical protein